MKTNHTPGLSAGIIAYYCGDHAVRVLRLFRTTARIQFIRDDGKVIRINVPHADLYLRQSVRS